MQHKSKDDAGFIFFDQLEDEDGDILRSRNKRFYIKKVKKAVRIKIRRKTKP